MSFTSLGDVIAAIEAHTAECDVTKACNRCNRYRCRCGALHAAYDEATGTHHERCEACRSKALIEGALSDFANTVPKHFRWALGADLPAIYERVKGSPDLIRRGMANPPATDFVFQGDTGVGKTSLAVAMMHELVGRDPKRWKGARFVAAYWLAGARGRHALGQGEAPEVVQAITAPLLLLDDVGSEASNHHNVIQDVIFARHNDDLPTWITTGFSEQQLSERYGSQVVRRPVEHGKRVQLGGK